MRPRHSLIAGLLIAGLAALAPAEASAKQVKYLGVHPIHIGGEETFCYIEAPHIHVYAPQEAEVLYRDEDEGHFFVGDPVPYGYDGPKHAYYGAHPVVIEADTEYCYLDGPHYHGYAPPPALKFTVQGGVHFYVGAFPAEFEVEKPALAKINVVYKRHHYPRPVVVVEPPPEYHGAVVHVEPAVEVVVPDPHIEAGVEVEVRVPAPVLEVHVPGVIVDVDGHHHAHGHGHGHGKKKIKAKVKGRWDD